MSPTFDNSQHPRADDGKFASKHLAESDVSLDDETGGFDHPDVQAEQLTPVTDTASQEIARVAHATDDEIWDLIDTGDPHTLTEIVAVRDLSGEQILSLADHSRPVLVRREVAQLPHSGIADLASRDPDVFVRMRALDGWDLSPGNRQRLERDPVVAAMRRIVSA